MRGPHTRLYGRIPQAGPCSSFRRVANCRHLLFGELATQDTRSVAQTKKPRMSGAFLLERIACVQEAFFAFFAPSAACLVTASKFDCEASVNCLATLDRFS